MIKICNVTTNENVNQCFHGNFAGLFIHPASIEYVRKRSEETESDVVSPRFSCEVLELGI